MQYAYNVPDYFGTFFNLFLPFPIPPNQKELEEVKRWQIEKNKKKLCKNNMNHVYRLRDKNGLK